ncbi:hypothetical protein [Amycolatopsis panacis]|uniref:Uncharacterized protein n=1 Tax=Amycolatopsis panacis TaxID=2340917 RepID=A0A419IBN5_9PSEU|nr:hypothetical protein [Amycolatopsis panacis]RJQ92392.1 hypothetical protein D5S19_01110 [Amycolatopsis panacis]
MDPEDFVRVHGRITIGGHTVACPTCGQTEPLVVTADGSLHCQYTHSFTDPEFGPSRARALLAQHAGGTYTRGGRRVGWDESAPVDAGTDWAFRAELDEHLGWPGGDVPVELPATITEDWVRLTFSADTSEARQWCRWLEWRGLVETGEPGTAVHTLLPRSAADSLWGLAVERWGMRVAAVPWQAMATTPTADTVPPLAVRRRILERLDARWNSAR